MAAQTALPIQSNGSVTLKLNGSVPLVDPTAHDCCCCDPCPAGLPSTYRLQCHYHAEFSSPSFPSDHTVFCDVDLDVTLTRDDATYGTCAWGFTPPIDAPICGAYFNHVVLHRVTPDVESGVPCGFELLFFPGSGPTITGDDPTAVWPDYHATITGINAHFDITGIIIS